MNCPSCGTELPADAQFCIECGVAIRQANTNPTVALPRTLDPTLRCPSCGSANPENALFCVRCGERIDVTQSTSLARPAPQPASTPVPPARRTATRRTQSQGWPYSGALFLIGMGLIFLLKLPFLPALFVLIGLTTFIGSAVSGNILAGLSPLVWMFAMAIFFAIPRLGVPAIFVAIGLQFIIAAAHRKGW
jgi:predicted nucleic acid-binding Zn ribbon protein